MSFTLYPGYFAIEPTSYQKADSTGLIQTVEAKAVNATFGKVVAVGPEHPGDNPLDAIMQTRAPAIGDLVFVRDGDKGRTLLPWGNQIGYVYICEPYEILAIERAVTADEQGRMDHGVYV